MTLDQSALLELSEMMQSADGGEVMRRLLSAMLQTLVDAEATAFIGAEPHERTELRKTQRNGTRAKTVTTAAWDLTVKIPKVRTGSFFPALLAPRRRIDVALHAVVMQAYVEGVSTRRVDDLVVAMGGTGISKSEVSRICGKLDAEVAAWRSRPLSDQPFPYLFCDATYCRGLIAGASVVFWAFGSPWLIPVLVAAGWWRHVTQEIPLRYEATLWSIVFRLAFTASPGTTWAARITCRSCVIGEKETWVALAVWALTFVAMVVHLVRTLLRPLISRPGGPAVVDGC
jgi:hypothetical protein